MFRPETKQAIRENWQYLVDNREAVFFLIGKILTFAIIGTIFTGRRDK